ncbi:GNAT family N-acetyltransferase [Microbacterium mitrae]|uniref:GNAT family N-acetyltransferase n=1 Tax=Microbacterium mitrae TaxID=664640 RepID=A0A5C8HNC2_9MICO|nr:GNAT family N-acetyltransferase [Microbacterium mitrae]
MNLTDVFAPLGVRVDAGPVSLVPITDDVLPALVDLALAGIHDAGFMPFAMPWTDAPEEELRAAYPKYHWGNRARWSADAWTLEFAVEFNGNLVGVQGISTSNYLVTRTGETGSWLGQEHHGRGIGTRMRQAMCAFMFDYAGAAEITSTAFIDNPNSLAVSRKVGYRADGEVRVKRRDEMAISKRLVLTPDAFVRGEPITVTGAEAFRAYIGLEN